MIRRIAGMITGLLAYMAVGIITLPLYWFFEMPKGKSWSDHMAKVLNIQS